MAFKAKAPLYLGGLSGRGEMRADALKRPSDAGTAMPDPDDWRRGGRTPTI